MPLAWRFLISCIFGLVGFLLVVFEQFDGFFYINALIFAVPVVLVILFELWGVEAVRIPGQLFDESGFPWFLGLCLPEPDNPIG